jgi:oligopeptide transport system substrate-binding protein
VSKKRGGIGTQFDGERGFYRISKRNKCPFHEPSDFLNKYYYLKKGGPITMRGKAKWSVFLALVLVMSMFLVACSGGGGEKSSGESGNGGNTNKTETKNAKDNGGSGQSPEQILHLTETGDIPSLDIHHATDAVSFEMDYEIFSGLMRLNENEEAIPDMAAEMPKVSSDKKVYTFKIRDDAKWSDGSPVTAEDFVYAWKRDVNPKEGGEYAYIFGSANIKNANEIMDEDSDLYGKVDKLGVKALDEKTLQVTLSQATPYFLDLMTFPPFYPLKKEVVEKYGKEYATSPDKMLYNGAFVMTQWDHGTGWTLEKNPKWWGADQVKLQGVDFKVVKETSSALNLYQTDKLDYTTLTSQYIDQFKDKPDFHKGVLTSTIYYLKLNEQNKALANRDIRNALYNAIDKEGLTNQIMKDGSLPAYYFVPKGYIKGPNGEDFRDENPTINKHSLKDAQASWENGLKEIGKDKVTLELLTTDTSESNDYGVYIKSQLEKNLPGLTVNINKQPSGSFFDLRSKGKYDLALSDWIPDYRDPMTYLDMFQSDNSSNQMSYSNPKYDQLVKEIHASGADPEKRWKLMHQAEKVLLNDAAVVPLWQSAIAYVKKPYVKDLKKRVASGLNWTHAYIKDH